MSEHQRANPTLISEAQVSARTSLSRATIYRLCKAGEFVAPVRISAGRVAWSADAVDAWIRSKLDAA
jgi:prophage regulatory protein